MARNPKLKVFRTPIGFHDAYVAAPSRKAALKAWGSDADLFARGVAEEVTDPALMRAPLDRPGEVVRLARGSAAEHLAAAGAERPKPKRKGSAATARRPARPSRDALKAAEKALATLERGHVEANDDLRARAESLKRQLAAIEREQRDLDATYERERKAAQAVADRERERHAAALDNWLSQRD